MQEDLTPKICDEFHNRAKHLPNISNPQFTGARRALVKELQLRCGISELWALNVINGYHARDYIAIIEFFRNGKNDKVDPEQIEYLKWLEEKEEREKMERLLLQDEIND